MPFFLIDESIISDMVNLAQLKKSDTILEIGAGIGNLTNKLSGSKSRIIAYEIDPQFKPILDTLPSNVEVHFESAWEFIQLHGKFRKKKVFNKIVSNLPYSFSEQLFHNLVPLKFLNTLNTNSVFTSFLSYTNIKTVTKQSFYSQPKTDSALITVRSLPDPVITQNPPLFLRQYIYRHEDQKTKNSSKFSNLDLNHHSSFKS